MKRPTTNEIIAKNLEALMSKRGLVQTALAKKSGIAQTTISLYRRPESRQPSKSGKIPSPKLTEVEALATALGVSLVQMLSQDLKVEPTPFVVSEAANDEEHAPIRLVDAKASAGHGDVILSQDTNKELMFRRDWLRKNGAKPERTIAFEVHGDSMVDAHIVNKAVVLANRDKAEPLAGHIYVMWIGDDLYVKELALVDDAWVARSCNAAKAAKYKDIPIDARSGLVGQAFWCGFGL